ncbi:uncharacterized protein LOC133914843 [Phragmites australis]|uniref:uncharacterized protein LOC133914843 n=1 Tax=Phragmites australis TaxID=29695 RepID=UPI002D798D1B|nr:uncharacterized protein LOC133914843 [Phragmites australis]
MDTTEQNAAASTDPAADLDAYLDAMRLDDPSSPRMQQHYQAPTTLRPPQHQHQPPQVAVPTARADAQFEAVRQYWPQPQPRRYSVGESSTGARYVSPFGSCTPSSFYASHYGAYSPRFTTPAEPFPSVSHSSSMPSSSSRYCQPTPSAPFCPAWDHNARLDPYASVASARHYDPIAPSHPSVSHSSMPSSSTRHCQPTPSAPQLGAPFCPAWDHNASLDRHASTHLSAVRPNQVDYRSWIDTPAVRRRPTMNEVRSRLLRCPMEPALARSPETAEHVVRLLQEGREEVRLSVLAGVKSAVHSVMGSNVGHAVFLALLRACEGRLDELYSIVLAVCNGTGFLMYVMKYDHGVTALKGLIMAVAPAPNHQLRLLLIVWLLRERLMEQSKGAELLHHCFTTLPYDGCLIMIQFAITNIDEMFLSESGSRCLAQCFANARNDELQALERIILSRTSEIARGQYSNYFLQRVLEWGSDLFKELVAIRVAEDAVSLSADQFGSYVVETCFLRTGLLEPAQRVLAAFLRLRNDQLAELVQGCYSNYVVHKLLSAGKDYFPELTVALARRIERLPAAVQREMYAQRVMRVVEKLLSRKPR